MSGIIGSVLGLVGLVSVYCDWVRWTVWSATSISVWQHVQLSKQIHQRDTLACCWDIKQPTNNNTPTAQSKHCILFCMLCTYTGQGAFHEQKQQPIHVKYCSKTNGDFSDKCPKGTQFVYMQVNQSHQFYQVCIHNHLSSTPLPSHTHPCMHISTVWDNSRPVSGVTQVCYTELPINWSSPLNIPTISFGSLFVGCLLNVSATC